MADLFTASWLLLVFALVHTKNSGETSHLEDDGGQHGLSSAEEDPEIELLFLARALR